MCLLHGQLSPRFELNLSRVPAAAVSLAARVFLALALARFAFAAALVPAFSLVFAMAILCL